MRKDSSGELAAVCLYCDTEIAVRPDEVAYCYCRSAGAAGEVVVRPLAPTRLHAAA